jgi:hypothetical protein
VQKVGPSTHYGESTESVADACRIAEEKAGSAAATYISELDSENWTCKKLIERTHEVQYPTVCQCSVRVEVDCEYVVEPPAS